MADPVASIRVNRAHLHRLHFRLARMGRLPVWTIYDQRTREYPGLFVARMHVLSPRQRPTRFVLLHEDLPGLRSLLPPGLVPFARAPTDAPVILEVWV